MVPNQVHLDWVRGLAQHPTGFPGVRPHGLKQPQQTGFGFQQRHPQPPIPPLPASYQQNVPHLRLLYLSSN